MLILNRALVCCAVFLIPFSAIDAQVNLTIDSSRSSAEFTLNGQPETSTVSGTLELELTPDQPPFSTARFVAIDATVNDGLSWSFFGNRVNVDTDPGIVMEMTVAGPAGAVNNMNQFSQAGNEADFSGNVNVDDPQNFAGGSQAFNLNQLGASSFDLVDVQMTVNGFDIEVEFELQTEIVLNDDFTLFVDMTMVADGVLPQPPVDVFPAIAIVARGLYTGGVPADLNASDNVDYSGQRNQTATTAIVEFEFQGSSPNLLPTEIEFTVESAVFARSQVNQTIFLLNWDTSQYENVDTRPANRFIDATVTVAAPGDLSRFVQPGTGNVNARVRYLSTSPRQNFGASVDYLFWRIR